jgi:hypothetical protein
MSFLVVLIHTLKLFEWNNNSYFQKHVEWNYLPFFVVTHLSNRVNTLFTVTSSYLILQGSLGDVSRKIITSRGSKESIQGEANTNRGEANKGEANKSDAEDKRGLQADKTDEDNKTDVNEESDREKASRKSGTASRNHVDRDHDAARKGGVNGMNHGESSESDVNDHARVTRAAESGSQLTSQGEHTGVQNTLLAESASKNAKAASKKRSSKNRGGLTVKVNTGLVSGPPSGQSPSGLSSADAGTNASASDNNYTRTPTTTTATRSTPPSTTRSTPPTTARSTSDNAPVNSNALDTNKPSTYNATSNPGMLYQIFVSGVSVLLFVVREDFRLQAMVRCVP